MFCAGCNRLIPKTADQCPYCGVDAEASRLRTARIYRWAAAGAVAGAVVGIGITLTFGVFAPPIGGAIIGASSGIGATLGVGIGFRTPSN
jgi:hypothetical protein